MFTKKGRWVLAALAIVAGSAAAAAAEEAKVPISASMLLNLTAPRAQARDAAFDASLKEAGPAPRSAEGEVLPDGSVRYGRTVVTVKNPCPPGTDHFEPRPLPGRRVRR